MKTKLLVAAMMLLFGLGANKALAYADRVEYSAINVNGTWYYAGQELGWCSGGGFHGANLGTISSLYLGGQSQVHDQNGADWGQGTMTMYYKFDDGAAQSLTLTYYDYANTYNFFQSGGWDFWPNSIDISGLSDGEHTIQVWFNSDSQWDNNNGNSNNYQATFTIPTVKPYATLSGSTLTFYYDGNKGSATGTVYDIPWDPSNEGDMPPGWLLDEANATISSVEFDPSFKDYELESASGMFFGCSSLTEIDLTNFNSSGLVCTIVMFGGCSSLTTIYCNDDWSQIESLQYSDGMFWGCTSLVGGNGTAYNVENDNDATYANPTNGYFTGLLEAYAVQNYQVLEFHYDRNKSSVSDKFPIYDLPWEGDQPEWTGEPESFEYTPSTVVFMDGFQNYDGLTTTANMFNGMSELNTVEGLTYLNTSNVTDMSNMFNGCSALTTIYCNNDWSGLNVTSTDMFAGCTNLVGGNGTTFQTAQVTGISYARPDAEGTPGYFTAQKDAYAVLDANGTLTFYYDLNKSNHTTGIVYNIPWNSGDQYDETSPGWVKYNYDQDENLIGNTSITSVTFDQSFSEYRLVSAYDMFSTLTALTSIDFTNFNAESVTNMSYMFYGCSSLTTIYCNEDWSQIESLQYSDGMFWGCTSLVGGSGTTYDADNIDVAYAHPDGWGYPGYFTQDEAYAMLNGNTLTFYYDHLANTREGDEFYVGDGSYPWWTPAHYLARRRITKTNDSNPWEIIEYVVFDPSFNGYTGLTDLSYMFYNLGSLKTINGLEYMNTTNVAYMSNMFLNCSSLTSLDFPASFVTDNVTNMSYMFQGCSNLENLDVSGFNTANVTDMSYMFSGCSGLTTIFCNEDWSQLGSLQYSDYMFSGCTNLVGGSETTYDANHIDVAYAHPDEGTDNPGYFTPALPSITLYNNSSNAETISAYGGKKANVTLSGRTLYKDGSWNTLCLPFDVTIAGSVLVDATVKTLESASFADNTLTLNFSEGNLAVMEAGKPYIIRWEGANISTTNLVEPKFNNVTVVSANPTVVETTSTGDATGTNWVDFRGIYEPWVINATNNEVLYLGGNNTLYYPKPSASGMTIGAFRAVFDLKNGLVAGDPNSASGIRAFNVNFGGEGNGITQIVTDEPQVSDWYTIDGRRLLEEPTRKGLYIKGGRKVMIK